jgi:hypothetical protein
MNILFTISQIDINNMIFSDSKKNIIMDGNFTKIIYSNHFISTNGIYIQFPINIVAIENVANKNIIKFNIRDLDNNIIIQSFSQLEMQILEYYKQFYNCTKTISTILHDQLQYGNIKLHIIDKPQLSTESFDPTSMKLFLKISGIWETENLVGITYKIMESL